MSPHDQEYHIARLLSGVSFVRVDGRRYKIAAPSPEHRVLAAEIQREAAHQASLDGLLAADEALAVLARRGIWSGEDQAQLDLLTEKLDEFKVGMYEGRDYPAKVEEIRKLLNTGRDELERLENRRGSIDHMTIDVVARTAKIRFLVGCSLRRTDGSPYWPDPEACWKRPDHVLERAMAKISADRLNSTELRLLARSPAVSALWAARTASSGFLPASATELADEQITFVQWITAYDNIGQRSDAPPRWVIEDDDLLDGWMILESGKRKEADLNAQFHAVTNDKIRGAGEVFVTMDPTARAGTLRSSPALVNQLNDAEAAMKKQTRAAYIKQHGEVSEAMLPDVQQRLRMEATNLLHGRS